MLGMGSQEADPFTITLCGSQHDVCSILNRCRTEHRNPDRSDRQDSPA
jgi:hypothetical protein